MDAEAVIDQLEKLPDEERQKVHEFILFRDDHEKIRGQAQEGVDALDRGEKVPGKEMFSRLRRKIQDLGK